MLLPLLFPLGSEAAQEATQEDQTTVDLFKRLRSTFFVHARLAVPTTVYEGISQRIFGRTHAHWNNPRYWLALLTRSSLWHPGDGLLLVEPAPLTYADILRRTPSLLAPPLPSVLPLLSPSSPAPSAPPGLPLCCAYCRACQCFVIKFVYHQKGACKYVLLDKSNLWVI